jgi:hypothetical protein
VQKNWKTIDVVMTASSQQSAARSGECLPVLAKFSTTFNFADHPHWLPKTKRGEQLDALRTL